MNTFEEQVREDVERALREDVGTGDLTAALVPADRHAQATIICRESAVICGRPWVTEVLRQIAPDSRATWFLSDGDRCEAGQKIVEIEGKARELLTAERTCLNWMQTLSAVATKTAAYVKAVEELQRAFWIRGKPFLVCVPRKSTPCAVAEEKPQDGPL